LACPRASSVLRGVVSDQPFEVVGAFENVTASAGLTTSLPAGRCGQFSSGAAWADIDGDADLDLVVTRLGESLQLYIYDGHSHFIEAAVARGLAGRGVNDAAFADYDNDGRPARCRARRLRPAVPQRRAPIHRCQYSRRIGDMNSPARLPMAWYIVVFGWYIVVSFGGASAGPSQTRGQHSDRRLCDPFSTSCGAF
jgi:FG-GAP-like repeat